MIRKLSIYFLFIVFPSCIFGQSEVSSYSAAIVERAASAPNTASLNKYFDVPVNMATGVPSIKIPIYTIKAGNLVFPITLSYNITGIKLNNRASWVGFGWDLECGGVVSKQVNGLDDFYAMVHYPIRDAIPYIPHSNYLNPDYTIDGNFGFQSMTEIIEAMRSGYMNNSTNANNMYKLLGRINQSKYDGESDEYHFTTPTGGGSIFYNQQTNSFQNNELNGTIIQGGIDGWNITQKDGITYSFTANEETLTPFDQDYTNYPSKYFSSAWYMTGAGDLVNDKGISLEYDYSPIMSMNNGMVNIQNWTMNGSPHTFAGGSNEQQTAYSRQRNIKTIIFPEGRVEFVKDVNARLDGGINALKTIKVFDKNNVLCKQFEMTYFYAWSNYANCARLFLQSIQEINHVNGSTTESKPYVINYNTSIVMAPPTSYAHDIWGYYNGKTSNNTNIPTESELMSYGIGPFADRSVDPNFTQAGIITQINYPTGGNLNFEFENNVDNSNSIVGGLRIKRITNYDPVANKNLITEYRYNDDFGVSTGVMEYRPEFHYYLDIGEMNIAHVRISGSPIRPLLSNQGSPVAYGRVEKIEIGNGTELKSRYYFSNNMQLVSMPEMSHQNLDIGVPYPKFSNIQRFKNLLYKTEVFRNNAGNYQLLKRDELEYDALNGFNKFIWNVQAAWGLSVGTFCEWAGNDPYTFQPLSPLPSIYAYKLVQESLINTYSLSQTFDQNNNVFAENVSKIYDQNNGNIKLLTKTSSNGDILRTRVLYVSDLAYTSSNDINNNEINLLKDNNINAQPVEIIKTIQKPGGVETILEATLNLFQNKRIKKAFRMFQNIPFSSFAQCNNNNSGFYYDSRYELENEIESFDASFNPNQIKLKAKTQALIWDQENIVASVTNASISDIAVSSFESNNKGQWEYYGNVLTDLSSPVGHRVYFLNGNPISKSGLNNSQIYTVSYWNNVGSSYIINGTTGTPGESLNGWTYFEHTVQPSFSTIIINGTGSIDEVRLYPKNTFMVSYSYLPLTGMQYQCDVNNRLTYYEYDPFGRLAIIRDQDKKVVKKFCYNYAGQPENCATNCNNINPIWQNTNTPIRCQQGSCGNTGYQEQEQKDVNPCSPTYNQIQWINLGYNPSSCSVGGSATLVSNNINNLVGFTAIYTHRTTGQVYSFSIPPNGQTIGCIPQGTYSLSISKPGNTYVLLFGTGCQTTSGLSANFSFVSVSSTSCNSIMIDWDL